MTTMTTSWMMTTDDDDDWMEYGQDNNDEKVLNDISDL